MHIAGLRKARKFQQDPFIYMIEHHQSKRKNDDLINKIKNQKIKIESSKQKTKKEGD